MEPARCCVMTFLSLFASYFSLCSLCLTLILTVSHVCFYRFTILLVVRMSILSILPPLQRTTMAVKTSLQAAVLRSTVSRYDLMEQVSSPQVLIRPHASFGSSSSPLLTPAVPVVQLDCKLRLPGNSPCRAKCSWSSIPFIAVSPRHPCQPRRPAQVAVRCLWPWRC